MTFCRLRPIDPGYPERLRRVGEAPVLTSDRPLDFTGKRVAIVGSREPEPGVVEWVTSVARGLAARGVTIVSGGAIGVDRAAHSGALDAGGSTWVVCTHGAGHRIVEPAANADLFERVRSSAGGRLLFPFADEVERTRFTTRARNRTLVGMAHVVLVVQARLASGSRNAIGWAHALGLPLFIVPGVPWSDAFAGSREALVRGVGTPLLEEGDLAVALGLQAAHPGRRQRKRSRGPAPPSLPLLDEHEKRIISHLSGHPKALREIAGSCGVTEVEVLTALLTLSVKNVVVEGPDGFFRLENSG